MAKDAKGHGSEKRGTAGMSQYAATHQGGIFSKVPNVEGASLWADLMAAAQAKEAKLNNPASREMSGLSPADLRGMAYG